MWNYRRRVLQQLFSSKRDSDQPLTDHIADLIANDLQFLVPLLRRFPKCYWIWNHRTWLLEQAKQQLPVSIAHKFWQEELGLVSKMLSLDSRNFHGWGYRRLVVESLRTLSADENEEKRISQEEFQYIKKMIGSNLSNFSAWHYRTKLIQRLLNEESAGDDERKKMLDEGELSYRVHVMKMFFS